MKITMVGPFPPYRGGIQQFNTRLFEELQTYADVSAINLSRQYPNFLFPGSSQYMENYQPLAQFETRLLDPLSPRSWYKTARHIASLKPDLVIIRHWMPFFAPAMGTVAKRLRKSVGCPVVCIVDNMTPHEPRPGDAALNKFIVKHSDHFVCMSQIVVDDLLKIDPQASYVKLTHPESAQFGATMDKQTAQEKLGIEEGPVILNFGLIREYKGVMTLLDALPEIAEKVGGTTMIVGEFYEDKGPYLEKIDSLDLGASIRLVDHFIPDDEVSLYFSAADVVVLPYKSATQSGILSIAQHFNVPSIVTDVGGLSEVVTHGTTGFVVPPEDAATLAAAVVEYFSGNYQSAMTEAMSANGDLYSWKTFAEGLLALGLSDAGDSGVAEV